MSNTLGQALRGLRIGKEQRLLAIQAIIIGVVVWIAVFALKESVHWLLHEVLHWIEHASTPLVLFIPLLIGALIVGAIAQFRASIINYRDDEGEVEPLNAVEGDGLERTIALYYSADPSVKKGLATEQTGLEARWQMPTFAMAVRKFVASLATLGSGGSGGLEASAALIGENLAAWYYKLHTNISRHRLGNLPESMSRPWEAPNPAYLQTAQLGGVAAAVTVLLGTPLAAAFFASEVMYRNRPLLEKLFYSLIAALTARLFSRLVAGARPMMFEVEEFVFPNVGDLRYGFALVLMAIVIAFVGQIYRISSAKSNAWFQKINNRFARLLVGFGITGVVALMVYYLTHSLELTDHGLELVLGSGESMVNMAFAGKVTLGMALIGLVAKMVATLATISSGGSAGLLVPALFFGTMIATAFAQFFEYEPMLFIVPAFAGSLIAIVNAPLTAILFAVEAFGAIYMIPVLVILIVTGLLSNPKTIYRTQQIALDSMEVLPGYDTRHVNLPKAWVGLTLNNLNLNEQFEVNVIGLLDRSEGDEEPEVLFSSTLTRTLEQDDVLVIYGRDQNLDALETAVANLQVQESQGAIR
jgi:CIC family chloride channel protein